MILFQVTNNETFNISISKYADFVSWGGLKAWLDKGWEQVTRVEVAADVSVWDAFSFNKTPDLRFPQIEVVIQVGNSSFVRIQSKF